MSGINPFQSAFGYITPPDLPRSGASSRAALGTVAETHVNARRIVHDSDLHVAPFVAGDVGGVESTENKLGACATLNGQSGEHSCQETAHRSDGENFVLVRFASLQISPKEKLQLSSKNDSVF